MVSRTNQTKSTNLKGKGRGKPRSKGTCGAAREEVGGHFGVDSVRGGEGRDQPLSPPNQMKSVRWLVRKVY
eukprot:3939441-Rhodomonas_salina.3